MNDLNPDLMMVLWLLIKEWGGKYEIAINDFASIPKGAGVSVHKTADGMTLILKAYDQRPTESGEDSPK